MENKHTHKWHTFTKPDMVICRECETVCELSVLLENVDKDARLESRVSTIGRLLFDRELKKPAHDREYAWVMKVNKGQSLTDQAQLL